MFKPGQLVKSYKYGSCYIVRGYYDDSKVNISPVSEPQRIIRCLVDRLFLIGNNYQTKTKAR